MKEKSVEIAVAVVAVTIWLGVGIAAGVEQYHKHQANNQLEEYCQGYGDAAEEISTAWPNLKKSEDFKVLFDQVTSNHPTIPEETVYLMFKYVYQVSGQKSVKEIRQVVQGACMKMHSDGVEV